MDLVIARLTLTAGILLLGITAEDVGRRYHKVMDDEETLEELQQRMNALHQRHLYWALGCCIVAWGHNVARTLTPWAGRWRNQEPLAGDSGCQYIGN